MEEGKPRMTYLSWEGEGEEVDEHFSQIGEEEQHNYSQGSADVVGDNDFSIILTELVNVWILYQQHFCGGV